MRGGGRRAEGYFRTGAANRMESPCRDSAQFRELVTKPCAAAIQSEACALVLTRGVGLYGIGCLDLAIATSPTAVLPPFRAYVCPRATGRLTQLCGASSTGSTAAGGAAGSTGGGDEGEFYKTAAGGLGLTSVALLSAVVKGDRHSRRWTNIIAERNYALQNEIAESKYLRGQVAGLQELPRTLEQDIVALAKRVPSDELAGVRLSEEAARHLGAQPGFKSFNTVVIRPE